MTETVATTVSLPVAAAPQGHLLDLALTGVIVALAAAFLYRRLWRNRGACSGCSGSKGKGGCASSPTPSTVCVPVSSLRRKASELDKALSAEDQGR